jgi:hypothetical protein
MTQQPRVVVVQNKSGPGCLVQALWFLFVGWWLGGILITIAWFLNITIIGLPLGMSILNNIPKVLALQEPTTQTRTVSYQGGTIVRQTELSASVVKGLFFNLCEAPSALPQNSFSQKVIFRAAIHQPF